MECVADHKTQINNTFNSVRDFSYTEKKEPLSREEDINEILDAINGFKRKLSEKTKKIYDLNQNLEKLTWIDEEIDDGCHKALNDLIAASKDLKSSLIRQYVHVNKDHLKRVAKSEITDFKNSIDELEESYKDLESVFFFLPNIPEFQEITKELSLI